MSQQLIPVNGGVNLNIQTTTLTPGLNILSDQYIQTNNLQSRPTEWIPGGRPIYRRLPAVSETYQINFFNVVNESNVLTTGTRVIPGIEEVGYVFVPYGESINGPTSVEVVASDNFETILIKAGVIVWEYGRTEVIPSIVNLRILEVLSGKYDIAYQLLYDDSPLEKLYEVSDFALTGQPLNITSSSDVTIGWRYPAVNAFLNTDGTFWQNRDSDFPAYAQPTVSFLQWESELAQAYSKVILRCPSGTAFTGSATLSYVTGASESVIESVSISSDSSGQFFEFQIPSPSLVTGWKVSFSSLDIAIQSISVSGVLTLEEPQATPSPRATLVMYPSGTLPKTEINSQGERIPATYCLLAQVDVNSAFKLTSITDERLIIHRDYVPVADWLTKPFDEDLINLYEQVSDYSKLWMAPPSSLKQEYINLSKDKIEVEA